jgi:hypothetical protein
MLLGLLLPAFALSAPTLSPSETYPVKKELRDAAAKAPKVLDLYYSAIEIDVQSYDPADTSGQPLMSTHTEQLVKTKKLPKDAAKKADGDRLEMTFEKMINESKVRIAGLKKPFETKSDFGTILSGRPFLIRYDANGDGHVENLDQIRAEALPKATDPMMRTGLSTLLNEKLLLKAGEATGQDSSCLGKLGGKKPGAKWSFSREDTGAKLNFDCTFEGWAENAGAKVAVVKIQCPKQRNARPQPNGVLGMVETEGSGTLYFDPAHDETVMRMESTSTAEPMADEIEKLKARGAVIPRNRTVIKTWNHLYVP